MPVKKKKGGKKKKKRTKSPESISDRKEKTFTEPDDPNTLISGTQTTNEKPGKKEKGKKNKKRMTKSEKILAKLEMDMDKIRLSPDVYNVFVDRMDKWIKNTASKATALFKTFDTSDDGLLTYDEFKLGMFDLNAPCNRIELHLLATLLDVENTGDINYMEFPKGLQYFRDVNELDYDEDETETTKLILTNRNIDHCACCKMGISEMYKESNPKYVLVDMRLVTFDNFRNHPGHFSIVVHSHITVYGLIQKIAEVTEIQSTKLSVFCDRTRSKDALLPPEQTLEDYGFHGDVKHNPEEVVLFYDYTVEFTDCPILMCDHYFGNNETKLFEET